MRGAEYCVLLLLVLLFVTATRALRKEMYGGSGFWVDMIEEVKQSGGFVDDAVSFVLMPNNEGIFLRASRDIAKDQVIIRIPGYITITSKNISDQFPAWSQFSFGDVVDHALYLAYLKLINSDHLFLKGIPEKCINGVYYPKNMIVSLDSRAKSYYLDLQANMRFKWSEIKDRIDLGQMDPELKGLEKITFNDFRWGYCIYCTRAFRATDGVSSVHIPIGDLLNHSPYQNTYWYNNSNNWEWITTRDILQGEEITDSYGDARENLDLVFFYGFVIPNNKNDKGYVLRTGDHTTKEFLLKEILKPTHLEWAEYTIDGFSEKELKVLRVVLLHPEHITSYHIAKIMDGGILYPLEVELWRFIYQECSRDLQLLPSSVEEDNVLHKHLLNSPTMHPRTKMLKSTILGYRMNRREFLTTTCKQFQERYEEEIKNEYNKQKKLKA